ncbi:hypothetical protein PybrP1_012955 [[Pythium] brassicae (nom. inval.)]|nr:hypothetical protein PybrP1_012955 [[Pythium] brassicae (nom. inval.)]
MGNESSTLSPRNARDDDGEGDGEFPDAACCGFRVLGIQEQSPASRAGFVSFFDFILEANGIRLDTKDSTLMELIAQSEDRPMRLSVYNVKSQTTRELELTPTRGWPGKGLLGVTIRFDSYEGAEDQLLHVLNVVQDSPAHQAGLRPESDYLLGTPERVFRDPEDLHDEILDALDDTFQCYVYNTAVDQVRIVSISPSEDWGGDGVLGAEVAHGYLHRLPSSSRSSIGTSVGFVSLSKDATAATDAYLRPERLSPSQDVAASDSTERQPSNEADEPETLAAQAPADTASTQDEHAASPGGSVANDTEDTPSSSSAVDANGESVPEDSAEAAAARAKPRYTARTDVRFPMSTVVVYADPTQLS